MKNLTKLYAVTAVSISSVCYGDTPQITIVDEERRQATAESTNGSSIVFNAIKKTDDPIKLIGQIDLASFYNWTLVGNIEYELETNEYLGGGSFSYERDDLSVLFSVSHSSENSTEFKAEIEFRF